MAKDAFVPTTDIFDRSIIYNARDLREFIVRLYQTTNRHAHAINERNAGYFIEEEFINGNTWFANPAYSSGTSTAPVPRKERTFVVNTGQLRASAGTDTIPHGITFDANTTFVDIYGAASNTAGTLYRPLPYVSATANEIIEVNVDGTNINITVGKDQSAFNTSYIVLKFLRG